MLYGREMAGPGDKELSAYLRNKREHTDAKKWVDELALKIRKIQREVREKIRDGRRTQQRYHDRRAKRTEYEPGDLVYWNKMVKGRKLSEKWLGPYKVIEKLSDKVYKVEGPRGRTMNLNVGQLKRCKATLKYIGDQKAREKGTRRNIPVKKGSSDDDTDEDSDLDWIREQDWSKMTHPKLDKTPRDGQEPDEEDASINEEGLEGRYDLRPRKHINYKE
jgi:hypothetical protein